MARTNRSETYVGEQMRRTPSDRAREQVAAAWAERKARQAVKEKWAKRGVWACVWITAGLIAARAGGFVG